MAKDPKKTLKKQGLHTKLLNRKKNATSRRRKALRLKALVTK
jgi:hypothetical protein